MNKYLRIFIDILRIIVFIILSVLIYIKKSFSGAFILALTATIASIIASVMDIIGRKK